MDFHSLSWAQKATPEISSKKPLPGPASPGMDRILLGWRLDELSGLSSALSAPGLGAGETEGSVREGPPEWTCGSILDELGECVSLAAPLAFVSLF